MSKVTPTRRRVLDAIAAHWQAKGYAPSFREIGDALGIASTNGVAYHVQALVKMGLLSQDQGSARTVRLSGVSRERQLLARLVECVDDLLDAERAEVMEFLRLTREEYADVWSR